MNVLFLCTGNTCRSIMAEAIFNQVPPTGWTAQSAGSHPGGTVNPLAIDTLERHGISTEGLTSKSWDDLPTTPDVVITLCSEAAGEACPAYLGPAIRAHWGMGDPSDVAGPPEARADAFEQAYRLLRHRVARLTEESKDIERGRRDETTAILGKIGASTPRA